MDLGRSDGKLRQEGALPPKGDLFREIIPGTLHEALEAYTQDILRHVIYRVEDCHCRIEMGYECVELTSQIASLEECQRQERSIERETTDDVKTYTLGS